MTRDFLLDSLGEPDRPVYDRAVDKVVNRLRQKLGDDGRQPRFILTQHGFGYSFAERARASLDVTPAQDPEAQPVDRLLTISVWPFRNLTGETPFDYLAAGLTDEVIVALARSRSFLVVGRSAAYGYGVGEATDRGRAPAGPREPLCRRGQTPQTRRRRRAGVGPSFRSGEPASSCGPRVSIGRCRTCSQCRRKR